MKKIFICLAVLCLLFSGCKNCSQGKPVNLPALDLEVYHDIKTIYPYGCYDNNDSSVKVTGWFVASNKYYKTYSFVLCDNEIVATDYNFSGNDITLEVDGYYSDFDVQIRQLIDSVDVTQKCYVIGKLVCRMFNQHFIGSCNEFIPVLIVDDIKNISFGKEVENEN